MPQTWLNSLDPEARARAEALIETLRGLGCPDPVHWAKREFREGIPQLSRFLLLGHLWSEGIDAWRDSHLWIDNLTEDAQKSADPTSREAGDALGRLLELGAEPADIARVARFVAYETVFTVAHTLDEGYDPEHEAPLPGWALVERDPLGHLTGRLLTRLHEDLLDSEPHNAPEPVD